MFANGHMEVKHVTNRLNRYEGRLFAESGTLFMVVQADAENDAARVSYRVKDETHVIEMPLSEVAKRVSAGSNLILDNLNSPESAKRLLEQEDGWYFASREGEIGPYESKADAGQAMGRYILSMQSVNDQPRQPARTSGKRRTDGVYSPAAQPATSV